MLASLVEPHLDLSFSSDQCIQGLQGLAQGRAKQALPCINIELGAVRVADDAGSAGIEVGIPAPRQR